MNKRTNVFGVPRVGALFFVIALCVQLQIVGAHGKFMRWRSVSPGAKFRSFFPGSAGGVGTSPTSPVATVQALRPHIGGASLAAGLQPLTSMGGAGSTVQLVPTVATLQPSQSRTRFDVRGRVGLRLRQSLLAIDPALRPVDVEVAGGFMLVGGPDIPLGGAAGRAGFRPREMADVSPGYFEAAMQYPGDLYRSATGAARGLYRRTVGAAMGQMEAGSAYSDFLAQRPQAEAQILAGIQKEVTGLEAGGRLRHRTPLEVARGMPREVIMKEAVRQRMQGQLSTLDKKEGILRGETERFDMPYQEWFGITTKAAELGERYIGAPMQQYVIDPTKRAAVKYVWQPAEQQMWEAFTPLMEMAVTAGKKAAIGEVKRVPGRAWRYMWPSQ